MHTHNFSDWEKIQSRPIGKYKDKEEEYQERRCDCRVREIRKIVVTKVI